MACARCAVGASYTYIHKIPIDTVLLGEAEAMKHAMKPPCFRGDSSDAFTLPSGSWVPRPPPYVLERSVWAELGLAMYHSVKSLMPYPPPLPNMPCLNFPLPLAALVRRVRRECSASRPKKGMGPDPEPDRGAAVVRVGARGVRAAAVYTQTRLRDALRVAARAGGRLGRFTSLHLARASARGPLWPSGHSVKRVRAIGLALCAHGRDCRGMQRDRTDEFHPQRPAAVVRIPSRLAGGASLRPQDHAQPVHRTGRVGC